MNVSKVTVLSTFLLLFWLELSNVKSEPMTVAAIGAAVAISAFLAGGICLVKECCTDRWISTNFTGIFLCNQIPGLFVFSDAF